MQHRGIGDLQNTDSMTERAQLALTDFCCLRVGVTQIEAIEDLATCVLTVEYSVLDFQIETTFSLCGLDVACIHAHVIPASRKSLHRFLRRDVGCVKVELCHEKLLRGMAGQERRRPITA